MNTQEAINHYEHGISHDIFKEPVTTYAKLAVEALREKKEREKGCEFCRERKPILSELGDLQIDDTDNSLWLICQAAADDIYEDHTEIHFCPMCGRDLRKDGCVAPD